MLIDRASKGLRTPALENKPELNIYLREVWNGFWLLSNSRQTGMGICSIPLSEIIVWLKLKNINNKDQQIEYIQFIQVMDAEYKRHHSETKHG